MIFTYNFKDGIEALGLDDIKTAFRSALECVAPPNVRYTNTVTKASLSVYRTRFALIVDMKDYEGEIYPETTLPTCKDIKAWVKKKYGFNVNSASITQIKKKFGLIADTEGRYVQKVQPEKETAIHEAFVRFGLLKE